MAEIESPFLDERSAARFLGLAVRTLQRFRMDGSGPRFVAAGRRRLYRISDLEAWANERTFQSTAEAQAAKSESAA